MTWDEAVAVALALPGTAMGTSYGRPAVVAQGRAFLSIGNEPATSFVLHLDRDLVAMLCETAPDTFWQSAHYRGYGAVLVRYDAPNDGPVRAMIERACAHAAALGPPRTRIKKHR